MQLYVHAGSGRYRQARQAGTQRHAAGTRWRHAARAHAPAHPRQRPRLQVHRLLQLGCQDGGKHGLAQQYLPGPPRRHCKQRRQGVKGQAGTLGRVADAAGAAAAWRRAQHAPGRLPPARLETHPTPPHPPARPPPAPPQSGGGGDRPAGASNPLSPRGWRPRPTAGRKKGVTAGGQLMQNSSPCQPLRGHNARGETLVGLRRGEGSSPRLPSLASGVWRRSRQIQIHARTACLCTPQTPLLSTQE